MAGAMKVVNHHVIIFNKQSIIREQKKIKKTYIDVENLPIRKTRV